MSPPAVTAMVNTSAMSKARLHPAGQRTRSRRGRLATVNLLLAAGANVNVTEAKGGQTALMWAVSESHADVTATLIRAGADVRARSKAGFTPLMFAAQQGDADSARLLLAAGANPNEAIPG